MRHLTVRDVMTTDVVTVRVTTPFKEVARLLEAHKVSAVPVLDDDDRLMGVVSEADLLLKHEFRASRRRAGWLTTSHLREVMAKVVGDVAGDLMTSPAVTIGSGATLVEAARKMSERKVKRLPVVDGEGRLAGIVSRADLVTAFLRSDEEIRDDIRHEVFRRVLLTEPGRVEVDVDDGVAVLSGKLDRKSSVEIAERLTRQVDGVVDVINQLTYIRDDIESETLRILGSR